MNKIKKWKTVFYKIEIARGITIKIERISAIFNGFGNIFCYFHTLMFNGKCYLYFMNYIKSTRKLKIIKT